MALSLQEQASPVGTPERIVVPRGILNAWCDHPLDGLLRPTFRMLPGDLVCLMGAAVGSQGQSGAARRAEPTRFLNTTMTCAPCRRALPGPTPECSGEGAQL